MITMQDSEDLQKRLAAVDDLINKNIVTKERGDIWKARIIDEFEESIIPKQIEKKLPNDLSHLPGRIVAGGIDVMKAVAKGSGATYEGLSRREGYLDEPSVPVTPKQKATVVQPVKKGKDIYDLINDLPEQYK